MARTELNERFLSRCRPLPTPHLSVSVATVLSALQSTSVGSSHDVLGLSFLLLQFSLSASAPSRTAM